MVSARSQSVPPATLAPTGAPRSALNALLDAHLRGAWRDASRLVQALEQLTAAHGLAAAALYNTAGPDFVLQAAAGAAREQLPARVAVQSGGLWAEALRHNTARFLPPGGPGPAVARGAFPVRVPGTDGPDGEWVLYVESAAELTLDARHDLAAWAPALAEAGQSRVALQNAQAGERRWAGLFTHAPVWCQTEHADGTIAEINAAGLELLGRERDEVVGHRLAEFCAPNSPLPQSAPPDAPAPGGALALPPEIQILPSHGPPLTLRQFAQPLYADGRLSGNRSVLLNVTAERDLERQLAEAQKMQAVGTLTAGIAHDFNNLLTTVLGQIELLRLRHARTLPDDANDRLGRMERAARRAAGLISQLLVFSRHDPQQMGPVEVWAAVLATVELLRHGLPENIEILRESRIPEAHIHGSLGQLQQALVNAAANAVAAMPDGGALTIALAAAPAPPRAGRPAPDDAPGWAVLSVSDTGYGMTEAVRQRAFEPFFTTRPSSESSGLGLAIVYGIVQAHHGHAEIESAPGHGTTLRMYFPLLPAGAATAPPAGTEAEAEGAQQRILLVEDDPAVADTTAQMLISSGYQVTVAHRPSQAMELCRTAARPFDLLLTDVTMPEMTGYQLADQVREAFGPIRALFVSGYDLHSTPGSSSRFLLQKPLNLRDLAAAVRQALAAELA
ncbi:MAG: ATP-binding protein [Terriglobales bacterium]